MVKVIRKTVSPTLANYWVINGIPLGNVIVIDDNGKDVTEVYRKKEEKYKSKHKEDENIWHTEILT